MTDEIAGTTPTPTEAQTAAPAETGTPSAPDEVTTLKSRNAGLDAKVTALIESQKKAEAAAAEATAKLSAYEAGKVGADEALRAQLQAKEAELETVRKEAALARIAAQYPETFAVLGEATASLSADKLAEAEARFKGVAETKTPPPIGTNPSRTQGGASTAQVNPAEDTVEAARNRLRNLVPPWVTPD